jgi:hypothetical protein
MYEAAAKLADEAGPDEVALRRVRDRAEIEELLLRHTMSVDLRDWELFRSCFADRVHVRFEPPVADAPDGPIAQEEWAALAGAALESPQATQHYYSFYPLRVDEDEAEAVMYYRAGHGDQVDAAPGAHSVYHTHRCRRTRAGWKIVEITAHALPDGAQLGPSSVASNDAGEPSQARPGRGSGKGSKRNGVESKRTHRSAAKRR